MTEFYKKVLLDHFWSFLPKGDTSKKTGYITHNSMWAPNNMLSFRKKTSFNFKKTSGQAKIQKDRRTNRRPDGRTKDQTDPNS